MTRSAVLIEYARVTDGRTDGIGVAYRPPTPYSMLSRVKTNLAAEEIIQCHVGLANPGRQTVPKPRSSGCKAPVAESCVGPWTQHVSMSADRSR